ncbi:sulfite exporter TauE/SafE family protein [Marinovum sp.]|uniref:sulfite exporter TauE/SafE family protein n=1 Tax=Marinovum sp. TaxID=2024839 RepID=UPI002B2697F5|nr:sulfite exporter TauE/SafE family protein [Marinovum sp.]
MLPAFSDPSALATIALALLAGGMLKGALGLGAPVIAVPVLASVFDVKLAVALMVLPNLTSNLWQVRQFRASQVPGRFPWVFAGAGALGAVLGTGLLIWLASDTLKLILSAAVLAYVGLRLARPGFILSPLRAGRLAAPVGLVGGMLQGAAGISAPASVSFLNAMQLARPVFISTISLFFAATTAMQLPLLIAAGVMTPAVLVVGMLAGAPLFLGMRIGGRLVGAISPRAFDRMILVLLVGLAFKLAGDALV